jgi:hypothetical protein
MGCCQRKMGFADTTRTREGQQPHLWSPEKRSELHEFVLAAKQRGERHRQMA